MAVMMMMMMMIMFVLYKAKPRIKKQGSINIKQTDGPLSLVGQAM
jgi:hypothetical protein